MSQRSNALVVGLVIAAVALVALSRSAYVVRVDQFAIITEFGKPVKTLTAPGLYFRIPIVQEVMFLDKRIRGWDDRQENTKTKDGRQIDYTAYARWKIVEPLAYYKAVGEEKRAHAAMDSIVTGRIQARMRSAKLVSLVRGTGRKFERREAVDLRAIFDVHKECNPSRNPEFKPEVLDVVMEDDPELDLPASAVMRSEMVQQMLVEANKELTVDYGIEVVDLHFKYLNYSPQVHSQIIEKIKTDRNKDIASYKKSGAKCVGYIRRVTKARRGSTLADGQKRVRELDGGAVARSIAVKSRAFSQDPELYKFLRTLELYEASLGADTRMVFSTDNPLLALMRDKDILATLEARELPALKLEPEYQLFEEPTKTPKAVPEEKPE